MASNKLEALVQPETTIGEGPHWKEDEKCLYYVDILQKKVYRYDPATGKNTSIVIEKDSADLVTLIVPIAGRKSEFLIGLGRRVCKLTWDGTDGGEHKVEDVSKVEEGKTDNRLNDGKVDHRGRLWAGTMKIENISTFENFAG